MTVIDLDVGGTTLYHTVLAYMKFWSDPDDMDPMGTPFRKWRNYVSATKTGDGFWTNTQIPILAGYERAIDPVLGSNPYTVGISPKTVLGDGPAGGDTRLASVLSLVNPSNRTASGRLDFFDSEGQPVTMPLQDGSAVTGLDFTIEAFGARTITTAGAGDQPRAGYALVTSDAPVEGTVTFRVQTLSGEILNETGVLGTRAFAGASAPILAEAAGGVGNGLALVNPGSEAAAVTLRLIPWDTALFAPMSTEFELGAGQHLARSLDELFEGLQGGYRGSLLAQAVGGSVAVVAVRTRSGLPLVGLPLATTQR